jgi:ATP adenylyltransferase
MPNAAFDRLSRFIRTTMRMSHIYQPLMLKTLLENRGRANRRELAAAFLSEDESQLEYYEQITQSMPGRILTQHGVVVREGRSYELAPEYSQLTAEEIAAAIRLCDEALARFKAQRGKRIWEHRAPGLGRMPGKLRYETLKRAGFRCELCGISADERALDVDQILPRKAGGRDVPENVQALCWKCNAAKGAGDDADLRTLRTAHAARQAGCVFCELPAERIIGQNSLAIAVRDQFPVAELHTLLLPVRHVPDYFDLVRGEDKAVRDLLDQARRDIMAADSTVKGFNVGINSGQVAGQTVFHCHIHLIPRRAGDVTDPRGGVRAVVAGQAAY